MPAKRRLVNKSAPRVSPPTRGRTLAVVVFAAVAIRAVFLLQLSGTPLADLQRWTESDMNYYDAWAQDVASGDWLSRHLPLPMHAWHVETADKYLTTHPEAARREAADAERDRTTPEARLWTRWMHAPQFYQDALYPYLLAGTYSVFGPHVQAAFAWQMLLGVLSVLLIWDLTRRDFGETTGQVAAALAVLCGPLVYYELLLLRESAIVFASLAVTWLAARALDRGRWHDDLLLGLALGASVLLKSSLLLMTAGVCLGFAVCYRAKPAVLARSVGLVLAGVAIAVLPLVARNIAVGVPAFSLASGGQLTFVTANEASNQPDQGNYINTDVLARFLGDTDGGWRAALTTAFAGHSWNSYLALLWEKWSWAWHWYELPNNENFYFAREKLPILAWLPVTAWVISPLALVGLVLGARRFRETWLLYLLVALALAPLIMFYVIGRFRILLLAAALPFAALTLVELVRAVQARRWARVTAVLASALVVGAWTGRPLPAGRPLIRTDDWLVPYVVRYQPEMQAAGERGDWAAAARACEAYFLDAPGGTALLTSGDPDLPPLMADIHMRCAAMWQRAGDAGRAAAQTDAANALRSGGIIR